MNKPALRFNGVSKSFAGAPALVEFSLDVQEGEFFGLVGENGAGKTTLIKCLLDFCETDDGIIEIFGVPHRYTSARGRLAFLPERFSPPHFLTGRDFLQYMARLYGVTYDEQRATEVFDRLDLRRSALDRPARAYSKGMTQKLGLAACLLSNRELYLFDEPASGLDPRARALFKRELEQLRQAGRTVFLTSHALADVEEICDRMAVLHGGRLRFAGTPAELTRGYGGTDLEQAFLACTAEAGAPP